MADAKTISPQKLQDEPPATLLDVRLLEDFEAEHLPNAQSNCIFEVAFVERLDSDEEKKSAACVVYGANAKSHEAEMAAERLAALGYTDVSILEGGIDAWKDSGLSVEGSGTPPQSPEIPSGSLPLNLEESFVQWTGRNLLNRHYGTIGLKSGKITVENGELVGGRIVIDMNAMSCQDLEGDMHDGLIGHLKSADFFETDTYPEAVFEVVSSKQVPNAAAGSQNLIIDAKLTMKGVTKPVQLGAIAGVTPEGKLAAQSSFLIDRTLWNVIYGSGKFFHRLGMHLVNDLIDVELKVVTE